MMHHLMGHSVSLSANAEQNGSTWLLDTVLSLGFSWEMN